eukprot:scpid82475/ scgid9346/ 
MHTDYIVPGMVQAVTSNGQLSSFLFLHSGNQIAHSYFIHLLQHAARKASELRRQRLNSQSVQVHLTSTTLNCKTSPEYRSNRKHSSPDDVHKIAHVLSLAVQGRKHDNSSQDRQESILQTYRHTVM